MKHSYTVGCECHRCVKELARRNAQSITDMRRFPKPIRRRATRTSTRRPAPGSLEAPESMKQLLSSFDGTSAEAIEGLLTVCFPDAKTIFDPTYGSGMFYKGSSRKVWGGDLNPVRAKSVCASYEAIPIVDHGVDVAIFDPPFQPETKNGLGLIGKRFTKVRDDDGGFGIGALTRLKESVQMGALEAERISRLGFIVKVQDYIHSRRPVWMSMWLWEIFGEPYDFLTVRAKSKMIAPSWQNQLSVWRNHSTYWVYRQNSKGNYHVLR